MVSHELAIEQRVAAHPQSRDEVCECYFRGITCQAKHGLTEKRVAECDTIKSADKPIIDPAFHRVGVAAAKQVNACAFDDRIYPSHLSPRPCRSTAINHRGEGAVACHMKAIAR